MREAKALVDQMLAFSRRKDSAKEPVDIVISLQETVNILKASLPKTIEIKTDFETPQAIINGNASQIMQAFMNLCVNARDAIDNNKGEIRIGVSLEFADEFPHPEAIWDSLPDPREQPRHGSRTWTPRKLASFSVIWRRNRPTSACASRIPAAA